MPLAVRIIPVILHRGEQAIKGKCFNSWRSVGHVRQLVRLYNAREVDELVVLDISATNEGREPDFDLIRDLAGDMYSPLAVGGGMRTLEHFQKALENGADKVVVNTAAIETPQLIRYASRRFGSQAVTVSIDCVPGGIATHSGGVYHECDVESLVKELEGLGAGEILLNSVERDGMMTGYDLDLIGRISTAVSIPVVACGGAGKLADFSLALDIGTHGVAASAIFNFTDITPADVAEYLRDTGRHVRLR